MFGSDFSNFFFETARECIFLGWATAQPRDRGPLKKYCQRRIVEKELSKKNCQRRMEALLSHLSVELPRVAGWEESG